MRIRDRVLSLKDRTRFALVLLALFGVILAATCGACVATVQAAMTTPGRTVAGQWDGLVGIKVHCKGFSKFGSGVIVSDNLVLTAKHVTDDHWYTTEEDIFTGEKTGHWTYCEDMKITVIEVDKTERPVTLEREASDSDVSALRLTGNSGFIDKPAIIGPRPGLGEIVCAVAYYPTPWRRCGTSQLSWNARIRIDVPAEHGNSGGPMYDSEGRLVGIVTLQSTGEGGQIMGMAGTALDNLRWLLE